MQPGAVAVAPRAPAEPRKPPRPPLRHRRDGTTLIGSLVLLFGVAWLAARTHTMAVSTEAVVAIALMLVGATMVLTARTDWALSRRRWPALAGAVLVLVAVSASPSLGVPGNWRDLRMGSKTVHAATWASLPAVVRGGIGRTTVDLGQLPVPPPAATALEVDATVGEVVVIVPFGVHTIIDAQLSAGNIQVNGVSVDNGFRPRAHEELSPGATGPALTLHISSGPGAVRIIQLSAARPPAVEPAGAVDPTIPAAPLPPGTR